MNDVINEPTWNSHSKFVEGTWSEDSESAKDQACKDADYNRLCNINEIKNEYFGEICAHTLDTKSLTTFYSWNGATECTPTGFLCCVPQTNAETAIDDVRVFAYVKTNLTEMSVKSPGRVYILCRKNLG